MGTCQIAWGRQAQGSHVSSRLYAPATTRLEVLFRVFASARLEAFPWACCSPASPRLAALFAPVRVSSVADAG